ncbi:MAG: hypothetical protein HY711_00580 [Candidatus Melainabacteria bacterium]|nr:hypothetical protein [Candidatus Melainabacteria bacterium]
MTKLAKLCFFFLTSSLLLVLVLLLPDNQAQQAIQDKPANGMTAGNADSTTNNPRALAQQPPILALSGIAETVMMFGINYRGVRIQRLANSELAESSGLEAGDILLSINGRAVLSPDDIDKILTSTASGDIELSFARKVNDTYKLIDNKVRFLNPNKNNLKAVEILPVGSSQSTNEQAARIVELINIERAQTSGRKTLAPLELNATLSKVATEHAEDMVKRHYFSHVNLEGQGPQERLHKAGVGSPLAENILSGALTPEEAHDELMNEPADDPYNHRGNILNHEFRFVGIGIARNPNQTLVVVETFAKAVPHTKVSPQGRGQTLPVGGEVTEKQPR